MTLAHWDEVEPRRRDAGHLQAGWRGLGEAAGSREIGLRRIEVEPGGFSTPAHEHAEEEEIFYVLAGGGLLWQEGATSPVATGDCIVHRPATGPHTLRAGADGLDVLVFGERRDPGLTALPRAGVAWSGDRWVSLPGGPHPWEREAAAGAPDTSATPGPRPANVVAEAHAPRAFGGAVRALGRAGGAQASGLNLVELEGGRMGAPLHCHSLEEELFVVLGGTATLVLERADGDDGREEHALRAGHVVSRPAGTAVCHAFRAGADGVRYLAYGTRRPNDMTFYPGDGVVALRGLGIRFRPELL